MIDAQFFSQLLHKPQPQLQEGIKIPKPPTLVLLRLWLGSGLLLRGLLFFLFLGLRPLPFREGIDVKPHRARHQLDFQPVLVIGADGQTTHIGRGLPKADLDWLRNNKSTF